MMQDSQRKGRIECPVLDRGMVNVSLDDADRRQVPRVLEGRLDRVAQVQADDGLTPYSQAIAACRPIPQPASRTSSPARSSRRRGLNQVLRLTTSSSNWNSLNWFHSKPNRSAVRSRNGERSEGSGSRRGMPRVRGYRVAQLPQVNTPSIAWPSGGDVVRFEPERFEAARTGEIIEVLRSHRRLAPGSGIVGWRTGGKGREFLVTSTAPGDFATCVPGHCKRYNRTGKNILRGDRYNSRASVSPIVARRRSSSSAHDSGLIS